ncbi:beta-carotene hydroxylase [Sorangium sp. So ce291]|uniref:beta-carotene hydroxylase n=1 Tax=Sorangium sp. So ce291 TaxID=3133294 RepID=UPI003F643FC2
MTLSHAIWIVTALAAFAAMEGWAALLHGKVWHHALWSIHRSHHARRRGLFERNDALSFLHAPVAVALILYGCMGAPGFLREAAFGFGLGMTAFGAAYVLVHDGLVHRRLPVSGLARVPYLARVRDAHRVHHSTGGAPYGLFLGPLVLARRAATAPLEAAAAAPPRSARRRAPRSAHRRAPQRAR